LPFLGRLSSVSPFLLFDHVLLVAAIGLLRPASMHHQRRGTKKEKASLTGFLPRHPLCLRVLVVNNLWAVSLAQRQCGCAPWDVLLSPMKVEVKPVHG
jgi:hypothetical protein